MDNQPYKMTLSLNLLNHLGINLYSSVPAVLSEVVANSWDADAELVTITIDSDKIVITDDGNGMAKNDINNRYLSIGYQRRNVPDGSITPKYQRKVMGRKGIGKLSLFSIARNITIYSVKDGEKNGFQMLLADIEKKIQQEESTYYPAELNDFPPDLTRGTRIILRDLKKRQRQTPAALRKQLARRFSILGSKHHFALSINNDPVTIEDRDYFSKIQFLWMYDLDDDFKHYFKNSDHSEVRKSTICWENDDGSSGKGNVIGWIGTVKSAGSLKDDAGNINKIVILVRGKMAQEDILDIFNEGGMYSKYIIGELHADFLDLDDSDDITTSSRQQFIDGDPRLKSLQDFVQQELKHIQKKWTSLRNDEGTKVALEIDAIKQWFNSLGEDHKKRAKSLFGKINQLTIDEPEDRKNLLKYAVLAFEHLSYKNNLDALEKIEPDDILLVGSIFSRLDDIEASLYYQIVRGRIEVIETLEKNVKDNALEKVIQNHIAEHLWLLDPSWERATDSKFVESRIYKEFYEAFGEEIKSDLTAEEQQARYDIKYSTISGTHIIIELKRPNVKTKTGALIDQGKKYQRILRKIIQKHNNHDPIIEVVFLVGQLPVGWDDKKERDEDIQSLQIKGMRILLYSELLDNARRVYSEYLEQRQSTGRIQKLLDSIDTASLLS
ncbi:MAG: DNA mismatch repair protein [Chlorobi bacterium OLB7]|nr:MAG: DNA mismatch repair protein [Chlorobi bacterium OLB7]